MKEFVSHSIAETEAMARQWLVDISKEYDGTDEALIVGLSGHLGAGKTAFVKAVGKALGVKDDITSPTFVLMKTYGFGSNGGNEPSSQDGVKFPWNWKRLVHIDAYRLEQAEELEALGWEDLVADRNNLIMVEWPENAGLKDLPLCYILSRTDPHHLSFKTK